MSVFNFPRNSHAVLHSTEPLTSPLTSPDACWCLVFSYSSVIVYSQVSPKSLIHLERGLLECTLIPRHSVNQWVHPLLCSPAEHAVVSGAWFTGFDPEEFSLPPQFFLSFSTSFPPWHESLSSTKPFDHAMSVFEATDNHELKLLKLQTKIILSSFKLLVWDFFVPMRRKWLKQIVILIGEGW